MRRKRNWTIEQRVKWLARKKITKYNSDAINDSIWEARQIIDHFDDDGYWNH